MTTKPPTQTPKPPVLILNPNRRAQLFWQTTWIALSPTQYRVLRLLATYPNQVIHNDALYNSIVYGQAEVEPQQVQQHIHGLRTLSMACSGYTLPIENIPRRGYVLNLPEMSIILVQPKEPPQCDNLTASTE